MRSLRATILGAFVLGACSSETAQRASMPSDAGVTDAPAPTEGPDPLPPPPPFSIEEEPEAPCVATTTATVRPVTEDGTVLTDLQAAGDRLVARELAGGGFVTFDADGANVRESAGAGSDNRIASASTGIVAAGVDATSGMLVARAFDPKATPVGAPQPLGPLRAGRTFTIAAGTRTPGSTIAVWVAPPSELRARVVHGSGAASAPIRLEDGADFDDLSIVAAPSPSTTDASEFLVVWALRRLALSSYRVYAALVAESGVVGLTRIVFGSDVRTTLAGLVSRPEGAVLLANRDGEPLVVALDVLGRASAPARLFHGARDPNVGGGQGLAFGHDRVAVVAAHASGAHAMRILRVDGRPDGGWVCLDAPSSDGFHLGSIVAAPGGWTTLVATPTGSALLAVDPSGTNAP